MADTSYEILIDTQTPGLAQAATGVTALEKGMRAEQAVIGNLDAAMRRLSKSGSANADVLARMSKASEASKSRLAGLGAQYAHASQNSNALVASQATVRDSTRALDGGLKAAAGGGIIAAALEKIAEKNPKLARVIRTVMVIGNVLASVGKTAVNFGMSVAKLSLGALEAQQADRITYEGLLHSEEAATALDKRVVALADTYGIATKDAGAWAATLIKAGVRGKDLSATLQGLAIRQAAIGDASEELGPLVDQLKSGERTSMGFLATQEKLFGPAASKRGKTFEASVDRIKRRFGELLASPAMSKGFDAVFGKLEAFMASPAAADFAASITGSIGGVLEKLPGMIDTAAQALPGLAGAFGAVASAIGKVGQTASAALGFVGKLLEGKVDQAFDAIGGTGSFSGGRTGHKLVMGENGKLVAESSAGGNAAGAALGDGMVAGIVSKTAAVAAASAVMAEAAEASAKSILGIASPSRVFAKLGRYTAEGFAGGVAASGAPQAAIGAMVAPPSNTNGGAGRRGVTQTINVTINGVRDGEHARGLIEAQLAEVLESAALSGGGMAA